MRLGIGIGTVSAMVASVMPSRSPSLGIGIGTWFAMVARVMPSRIGSLGIGIGTVYARVVGRARIMPKTWHERR